MKEKKYYKVTIYTRSNACINPDEVIFHYVAEARTTKQAKLYAWQFFDTRFNITGYSRYDLRIEAKPFASEW